MTDGAAESVFDQPTPARSPAGLLDPRSGVLPWYGHAHELAALVGWCEQPKLGIVRLLATAPGRGATRLGVELVRTMRARGWTAGLLRDHPDEQALARLAAGPEPLLVVVNDAEVRGADVAALQPLFTSAPQQQARILLIGDTELLTPLEPAFEHLGHPYYTVSRDLAAPELTVSARRKIWQEAVAALGSALGVSASPLPADPVDGTTVAEIQFAALAALLTEPVVASESRYWQQAAIEHQLFFLDPQACAPLVAQAAIWGADTRDEALRLVTAIAAPWASEPAVAERITDWLAGLYPGPGHFWRFPRALAAHLAAPEDAPSLDGLLAGAPTADGPLLAGPSAAGDWLLAGASAADGSLLAGASAADDAQLRRAAELLLPVLPRSPRVRAALVDAVQSPTQRWSQAIVPAALAVPQANDGIIALVAALDRGDGDALNFLAELEQALPASAEPLREAALAVTQKLVDALTWVNEGQLDVAIALYSSHLAIRLADLDRFDEAVEASRRAVDLMRPHATGALVAELARMLRNYATDLLAAGHRKQAVPVADESAVLYRQLYADDDAQLGLAAVLLTRAEALRELGCAGDGHAAAREALTLIEPLARQDRHVAETWLTRARSLQPPD